MAAARSEDHVAGMGEVMKQASQGLKLFKAEEALETDLPAAEAFKTEIEAQIAALEAEAATLTGKDNKKERTAKGKQVSDLKANPQYIDACKVVKGLEPKNGFFVTNPKAAAEETKVEAPKVEVVQPDAKKEPKKDAKKESKKQSAGISPAETAELEKLKNDIIERKNKLKAEGLSGGQQNKDEQIVQWVTRMNELKEKAEPGSTAKDAKKDDKKKKSKAPLSAEEQKEADQLAGEIELYKHRLKTEFGYSNKEIKIDPDLVEMEATLAAFEKRGA
jgi:hypothetical protein